MNNRISSGMMYDQSVFLMLARQSKLNHLERQLATGQKIVSAKDDPVASGTAVGMDRILAELTQLGSNAATAQNRLGLQENALAQAGELLQRVSELTIQANNAALSAADRKSSAAELRSIRDSLLSLANSTDGNGRFLFGGAADGAAPFIAAGGSVAYNGDQTQRQVEIAPGTFVQDALPGSEIFMRVRTGDGIVDGNAASGNTGQAVLTDIGRDGSANWNGESWTLRFTAPDTYEIVDAGSNVVGGGTYVPGEDIVFQGLRVRLNGTPEANDEFNVGTAGNRDVFATLERLAQALEMDASTLAGRTAQQNLLQSSLRDVARASEKLIDSRASGGAQLGAIDNAASLREANAITLKDSLSQLRDLDYAEAIGQYKLESAALQAAQTLFTQMQSMSLFNMIR
ncbi:MAG: flagellar hook-associated protein FlgL [Stenotrophomonas nitritireducens]|uniref:flagellar hook-associated protein FlgL n=1 Tax=Stenotrophomonas nitritireducens TaxID=83617 RepID=UPI001AD13386|nr:flagellar hook-associated protein FlgL [Stenotrophomonas nitritireducens]MBN8768929.1 flagellar hook-associated protein FlgL [Stenotrophomonas sp.]MBN8792967.1 flagellar hook-associated protein FlgL [Stenotrophomonas nitritireducens]